MRELEERTPPQEAVEDELLAFVAFALNHAACGDGVLELRLGRRCILQWCQPCATMRTFVSPDE